MLLIIDNYDSFTYNLLHYIQDITDETIDVYRNDKICIDAINKYDKIILSPGPGLPANSGIMCQIIKRYGSGKRIL